MKTKANTKKKISTKPKSKALKQGAVSGSLPKKDVEKVMKWLLGYYKSFPCYKEGEGLYYWRKALRVKIKRELGIVFGLLLMCCYAFALFFRVDFQ